MTKFIKVLLALFLFFMTAVFLPHKAFAHFANLPYLFMNGKYALFYPVYSSSIENFNLPQDLAPENYLIGDTIHFELDMTRLPPLPTDPRIKVTFLWNFGDGTKGTGQKIDHTYQKMGSYVIDLEADDSTGSGPQPFDLIMVNVLPTKSYELPQAFVSVNGQTVKDPVTDILYLPFGQELSFDASGSSGGSGGIKSYFWDFGDQKTSNQKVAYHSYQKDLQLFFPLLRVTDNNGFFADSYVQITNQVYSTGVGNSLGGTGQGSGISKNTTKSQLPFTLLGIVFYLMFMVLLRYFVLSFSRPKTPQSQPRRYFRR